MSKQEQLHEVLEDLRNAMPDLRGALVASTDGLAIAEALNSGDANRVAAMAATALGLGKRIGTTLELGELRETTVRGEDGQVFLYAVENKAVLAVIAPGNVNVGLVNLEARDAAARLTEIL